MVHLTSTTVTVFPAPYTQKNCIILHVGVRRSTCQQDLNGSGLSPSYGGIRVNSFSSFPSCCYSSFSLALLPFSPLTDLNEDNMGAVNFGKGLIALTHIERDESRKKMKGAFSGYLYFLQGSWQGSLGTRGNPSLSKLLSRLPGSVWNDLSWCSGAPVSPGWAGEPPTSLSAPA